jgi:hypothetical protein
MQVCMDGRAKLPTHTLVSVMEAKSPVTGMPVWSG